MMIPTGWYDVPNEEYHNSEKYRYCLTNSGLKRIDQSPLHWFTERTQAGEPTPAMAFGSAFHAYMLEPEKILGTHTTKKEVLFNEYDAECMTVSEDAERKLDGMKRSLLACELSSLIVNHSNRVIEQAGFFIDPHRMNVVGSIKPDIRIPELGIIADLKTTTDSSLVAFSRSARRFKYDWQAFWYLRGANAIGPERYDKFLIIAIEKTPPYGVMLYEITSLLYWAEIRIVPLIEKFSLCLEMGRWPGYKNDEIYDI